MTNNKPHAIIMSKETPTSPPMLFPSPLPIGGRLSAFWVERRKIGAKNWVLGTPRVGYNIVSHSRPSINDHARYEYNMLRILSGGILFPKWLE